MATGALARSPWDRLLYAHRQVEAEKVRESDLIRGRDRIHYLRIVQIHRWQEDTILLTQIVLSPRDEAYYERVAPVYDEGELVHIRRRRFRVRSGRHRAVEAS